MNFIQTLISDELIYALGWTMVHSLWQGVLIAFIMFAALYFLQNKSAKIRYEVSALSLFSLFIVSLCTFLLFFESTSNAPLEVILMKYTGDGFTQPVALWESYQWTATKYFNQQLPVLVTIWFLGVGFFLLRLFGGLVFIQKLKHQQNRPLEDKWQRKLHQFLRRLPLYRTIQLRESALINVPMVVGYFKPMILLPVGAVNNLSSSEVEAILAHELAHVFRNDYILNIILSFIEVLFYYHPAVWLMSASVRSERENCADDLAIELCGNSLSYAKALISLEELNPNVPVFAMSFSGQKNQLLSRIQRILKQPQNRSNILEKLTATGFILLAMVLISFSSGKSTQLLEDNSFSTIIEHDTPFNRFNRALEVKSPKLLFDTDNTFSGLIRRDTVPKPPKKNETHRITQADDNGTFEVEFNNDQITKLKIDGKVIPEDEYEDYKDKIEELKSIPPPPAPPIAPAPPGAPAPPVAPAPLRKRTQTIITSEEDGDGHTIISINGADGPMEISISPDNTIFVDGENIEEGDSMIIVNNYRDHGSSYFFSNGRYHNLEKEMQNLRNQMIGSGTEERKELDQKLKRLYREQVEIKQEAKERAREAHDLSEEAHILAEETQSLREEALARMEEARERAEETRMEAHARMEEARERAEEARMEARERAEEARMEAHASREEAMAMAEEARAHRDEQRHEALIDQLIADGLVERGGDYSIKFNNEKLKVNGKTVSDEMHQKYLNLYGADHGKHFNIHIEKH